MANTKRTTKPSKTSRAGRRTTASGRRVLEIEHVAVDPAQPARRSRPRRRSLVGTAAAGLGTLAATDAVRRGLRFGARRAWLDAIMTVLALGVLLIGMGILMAALVPGLAGYIEPLWLRMVIAALSYVAAGSLLTGLFARRLKRDALGGAVVARRTAGVLRRMRQA